MNRANDAAKDSPTDPRLAAVREALRSSAPHSGPDLEKPRERLQESPSKPDRAFTHAAVSLVLRPGTEDLDLLLIRRAEAEGDPWSGDMALPGGRRDPGDPDLLYTAIRETYEETGVALDAREGYLGQLPAVEPSTRRLPPILIQPFVFSAPPRAVARPESAEVEEVIWIGASALQQDVSLDTVEIEVGGTRRVFPCYRLEGRVVWGLTYRILKRFSEILPLVGIA